MAHHSVFGMKFSKLYPLYIDKAEKKGRTKAEVDEIISWLFGYGQEALEAALERDVDVETFITNCPQLNPASSSIKGVVCGVRVEDIAEPTMQRLRFLDKLIDELAKGKAMETILRRD